jgi:hypothetical protein
MRALIQALTTVALLGCSAQVSGPTADISGIVDGIHQSVHRIFLTSQTYAPNFGGLGAMDTICNTTASAAGLQRSYRAVAASTAETLATRFQSAQAVMIYSAADSSFHDVATSLVAATSGGSLLHTVSLDQNGAAVTGAAWTCYNSIDCCSNWNDATAGTNAIVGQSSSLSNWWLNVTSSTCNGAFPRKLYCVRAAWNGSAWVF